MTEGGEGKKIDLELSVPPSFVCSVTMPTDLCEIRVMATVDKKENETADCMGMSVAQQVVIGSDDSVDDLSCGVVFTAENWQIKKMLTVHAKVGIKVTQYNVFYHLGWTQVVKMFKQEKKKLTLWILCQIDPQEIVYMCCPPPPPPPSVSLQCYAYCIWVRKLKNIDHVHLARHCLINHLWYIKKCVSLIVIIMWLWIGFQVDNMYDGDQERGITVVGSVYENNTQVEGLQLMLAKVQVWKFGARTKCKLIQIKLKT